MEHDTHFENQGIESAGYGAAAILRERKKQIEVYGFTAEVDHKQNTDLLQIVAGMMLPDGVVSDAEIKEESPVAFDLRAKHSPMERLIIAGAFLAAEIDRMHYFANEHFSEEE